MARSGVEHELSGIRPGKDLRAGRRNGRVWYWRRRRYCRRRGWTWRQCGAGGETPYHRGIARESKPIRPGKATIPVRAIAVDLTLGHRLGGRYSIHLVHRPRDDPDGDPGCLRSDCSREQHEDREPDFHWNSSHEWGGAQPWSKIVTSPSCLPSCAKPVPLP
jgi:hypothetical protein